MGNSVADFKQYDRFAKRDRQRVQITGTAVSQTYADGGVQDRTLYSSGSAERCLDTNDSNFHMLMRMRKKYPRLRSFDLGHSFAKESVSLSMPLIFKDKRTTTNFNGIFFPTTDYRAMMQALSRGVFPALSADLGADRIMLWGLGSTAIAKSIPDIPDFSLFRFIGELKAGLPKVPLQVLAKEKKLRNVGGEYLNYQFGIMPTISDLQNLYEALHDPNLRSALKHQQKREFRVRKVIDKGTVRSIVPITGAQTSTLSGVHTTSIAVTKESVRTYRIWSSISFAYHQVNELDRLMNDLDDQLGGLGAIPTAIDIWNLIPWSWLVDWFTNFNHVMTNLSYLGKDGLYMRHGYIMGTFTDEQIYRQKRTYMGRERETIGILKTERKYRVKASPFGFGLTWKDFDPFQLSILGALGVSRLRF